MELTGNIEILHKKIKEALEQNKTQEEEVIFCINGQFHQALVALPKRLLIIKHGMMADVPLGVKVTSFQYEDITGTEINTGSAFSLGYIEITTPSFETTKVKHAEKLPNCIPIRGDNLKEYKPYLEKLKALVDKAKSPIAPSATRENGDIVSKIEKLAKLYQTGALTEEEFNSAKKKLLEF